MLVRKTRPKGGKVARNDIIKAHYSFSLSAENYVRRCARVIVADSRVAGRSAMVSESLGLTWSLV